MEGFLKKPKEEESTKKTKLSWFASKSTSEYRLFHCKIQTDENASNV